MWRSTAMILVFTVAVQAAAASAQNATPLPPFSMSGPGGIASNVNLAPAAQGLRVDEALGLISKGKPDEAVALLDGVIASEEAAHRDEKTMYFCARSNVEAIYYSALAMTAGRSAIVADDSWANAYYLEGYALIDLRRPDEAKAMLDKALKLSPQNAHYQAELAEWHKARGEWTLAFGSFEAAASASEFSPDHAKAAEKGRALRCRAFAKVELGDLKAAEKILKQALKLNPADARTKFDLEDVYRRRGKTS